MTASPRLGLLTRLRRDGRGASAVEFALLAPILIGLYFGLAEYCQAMMADRKATHAAASVGDLVAQSTQVTAADVDDIFRVGGTLMTPFPVTDLKMAVANVTVDSVTGVAKVTWGRAYNMTARAKGETVTLPVNTTDPTKPFVDKGQSVIMSEVEYSYDSPVDYLVKNKIVFKETFYLRPRKAETVVCSDC